LPVSFNGGQSGSEVTVDLQPGQEVRFTLTFESKKAKIGYIQVDGGGYYSSFSGISGTVTRKNIYSGESVSSELSRPEKANNLSVQFGGGSDTALVVLNPPQFPANTGNVVAFWLYDEYGRLVAVQSRIRFHAGAQKAFFLSELFRDNPDWEEWYADRVNRGFPVFKGALSVVHGQGVVSASVIYQ